MAKLEVLPSFDCLNSYGFSELDCSIFLLFSCLIFPLLTRLPRWPRLWEYAAFQWLHSCVCCSSARGSKLFFYFPSPGKPFMVPLELFGGRCVWGESFQLGLVIWRNQIIRFASIKHLIKDFQKHILLKVCFGVLEVKVASLYRSNLSPCLSLDFDALLILACLHLLVSLAPP